MGGQSRFGEREDTPPEQNGVREGGVDRERLPVGVQCGQGVLLRLVDLAQGGMKKAAPEGILLPAQGTAQGEEGLFVASPGLQGEAEEVFALLVEGRQRKAALEGLKVPDGGVVSSFREIVKPEAV